MTADVEKTAAAAAQTPLMSQWRILKNLLVTCLGFLFLFSAFQSLSSLQTTINRQGSMSQSLIYGSFALSSLLLPKLMITKLGCKTTLVLSMLAYIPFMVSNYYRDFLSQLFTSILLGVGGATLWSSACTYVNEISLLYSSQVSDTSEVVTTRFFGIFFMIFQNSQIWGNLVTFYVLKPSYNDTSEKKVSSYPEVTPDNVSVPCGANFCGGIGPSEFSMSEERRFLLITVYLIFTVFSAVILFFFLDPLQRNDSKADSNVIFAKLTATVKHLRKPEQLLLIPLTVFQGFEQAFVLSDFSQGYIACAWGLHNVSLVFIFFGAVNSLACFVTGRISKYAPRICILLTAAMGNAVACIIMFLWDPDRNNAVYFFIIIGLWAVSDAIWQTVVSSMYGILFREDEEAAFGNLRLWEAVGFFIPYFFNTLLCMSSKLYLVIALLALGISGGIAVELKTSLGNKSKQ